MSMFDGMGDSLKSLADGYKARQEAKGAAEARRIADAETARAQIKSQSTNDIMAKMNQTYLMIGVGVAALLGFVGLVRR